MYFTVKIKTMQINQILRGFTFLSVFIITFCASLMSCTAPASTQLDLASPDGKLSVNLTFDKKNGALRYSVKNGETTVLEESALGLLLNEEVIAEGLQLVGYSEPKTIWDQYEMYFGKQKSISYNANEITAMLRSSKGTSVNLVFRVSDDAVAFKYVFPNETGVYQVIQQELTSYQFPASTRMFVQPMAQAKSGWEQCNPSYEEHYSQGIPVGTPAPLGAGWIYPALFQVENNWVLITEANLGANYCGTRLIADSVSKAMKIGFPSDQETFTGGGHLPNSDVAWESPWRIITVGGLNTIVESTIGTDLAAPAIRMDESHIKPGYASWSWVILKDNSVNFETTWEFIDYAADMGWPYCLIDADWHKRIGEERIKELVAHANEKNVGLILWYNSAGDWNTTPYGPRNVMLTHESRMSEFAKLEQMGIKGLKIDFFGGDGQSMIAYYHDILKDAASFDLLINFHGATLPRGWQRTYPHLMTMESIKGMEFITFEQGNADLAPNHCAMLPFTRNAFDPMDFTPMCFSEIPGIQRKTTNAFELALPTLFISGIQHMAEIPQGMAAVPAYVKTYLSELPIQWDETRFIDGFPGKLAVLARRSGNDWYVTGINGEALEKTLTIDLSFAGNAAGYLITDGANHPEFVQTEVNLGNNKEVTVTLKPNGGLVMKLTQL